MFYNRDDAPFYLFERFLEKHPEAKTMVNEYKPHALFDDLFTDMLGEEGAPEHRWFLIGPKRSGS